MKIQIILIAAFLGFAVSCGSGGSGDTAKNDSTIMIGVQLKDSVVDIDGNVYHTVKIGTQVWMTENLKVTHYLNGDEIPNITDSAEWNTLTSGAFCNYNNDTSMPETYGRLYNWYALNDKRGLAPEGWHVPGYEEWNSLANYLGGTEVAGGKLKSKKGWSRENKGADNTSGFTGLPGGIRDSSGIFEDIGEIGFWWSATDGTPKGYASGKCLTDYFTDLGPSFGFKTSGWSVRCIKD